LQAKADQLQQADKTQLQADNIEQLLEQNAHNTVNLNLYLAPRAICDLDEQRDLLAEVGEPSCCLLVHEMAALVLVLVSDLLERHQQQPSEGEL
jgi:hypothetical protein